MDFKDFKWFERKRSVKNVYGNGNWYCKRVQVEGDLWSHDTQVVGIEQTFSRKSEVESTIKETFQKSQGSDTIQRKDTRGYYRRRTGITL